MKKLQSGDGERLPGARVLYTIRPAWPFHARRCALPLHSARHGNLAFFFFGLGVVMEFISRNNQEIRGTTLVPFFWACRICTTIFFFGIFGSLIQNHTFAEGYFSNARLKLLNADPPDAPLGVMMMSFICSWLSSCVTTLSHVSRGRDASQGSQ